MTRFDAASPEERRKLFVEAIRAHRERGSPFLTVEAAGIGAGAADGADEAGGTDAAGSADGGAGESEAAGEGEAPGAGDELPPWIQFGDGVLNIDCTEAELDRLKDLLGEYPAFRIDEITRPEEAEGANVRVSARADANRIAGFVDEVFRAVYGRPADYRAWVVEV